MDARIQINTRVDEVLKSKINQAAEKKGLPISDFIREVLERESELVLMDKSEVPDRAILRDIWARVSFVEASVKDSKNMTDKMIDEYKNYADKVETKVRNENLK